LAANENYRSSGGGWAIWRRLLPRLFTDDKHDEEKYSPDVAAIRFSPASLPCTILGSGPAGSRQISTVE
jgi:hypothetical protein